MSDKLKETIENNRILEIRTGSHLYGTNTPQSDEDYVGIFMPPIDCIYGLNNAEEINLSVVSKQEDGKNDSDAIDRKFYDFIKFCRLALNNNPNILEILYANNKNIIYKNKYGMTLLESRELFPSKLLVKGFLGYAQAQKKKMEIKSSKYIELKEGYEILEREDNDAVMADIILQYPKSFYIKTNDLKYIWCGDICVERGVFVKKARKIIKRRLDSATSRSELILKHGYDTKFASHLIRLLYTGLEFLNTQRIIFPLQQADLLLAIKAGEYNIKQIISMAEELENKYRDAEEKTLLPASPNYNKVEDMVIKLMRKHANETYSENISY